MPISLCRPAPSPSTYSALPRSPPWPCVPLFRSSSFKKMGGGGGVAILDGNELTVPELRNKQLKLFLSFPLDFWKCFTSLFGKVFPAHNVYFAKLLNDRRWVKATQVLLFFSQLEYVYMYYILVYVHYVYFIINIWGTKAHSLCMCFCIGLV